MKHLPICLALAGLPLAANASAYSWNAASGLLPDQVDPRMALIDTSPGANPLLGAQVLTLATNADPELLYYAQAGVDLALPAVLEIDATLRLGPGSTGPGNSGSVAPRTHASIVFTSAAGGGSGNAVFIGSDRIFLLSGPDNLGAEAQLPTGATLRQYHIVVGSGAVGVWVDGQLALSGALVNGGIFAGAADRISFGESTLGAHGLSEWASFSHNAAASPVPELPTLALTLLGLGVLALRRGVPA